MKVAAARGWLFGGASPGSGKPAVPVGLALTPAGRIATVDGDEAVRQAIALLLGTIPGERVMRPDYGCALHRLVFAPNDATTAGLAIHYVRQALLRHEPRVEIVSLDARPTEENPASLTVSLVYLVKATNRRALLEFSVDLNGEPG